MKKFDMSKSVFYERYKPQCVEDLILPPKFKTELQASVNSQDIPALGLFSSNPGTGKSSTANAVVREIGGEALWINASMEKGIDVLRGKIQKFASQSAFDDNIKIVVMDEFDNFTGDGQKAFRGFIDEFNANCRFIFTGNYKEKIIEPLLDRLEVYDFNTFSKDDMVRPVFDRLRFILDNEGITYDPKALIPVINTYYPSIRSMIGALQKFSKSGEFLVKDGELDDTNVFEGIMAHLTPATYTSLITEVNKLNAPDGMYSYLYQNAGKFFAPPKYPNVVMVIAKYQHMTSSVRDKNLNLAACLTELIPLK